MTRTIEIELSPDSIKKALRELYVYRRNIRSKYDELCRRLAEIGAEEARRRFAMAEDGNGNVQVTVEKIYNGYKIVASGEDVYFIEFGTGNAAGAFYGEGLPSTNVPIYPGSWSEEHSKMYSNYGYWFYKGKIMSSTDAYMPMYYAGKAIRENEKRIAKEILGK